MSEERKDFGGASEKDQTLEAFISGSDNVHFKRLSLEALTLEDRAIFDKFMADQLTDQELSEHEHRVDQEEDAKMRTVGIVESRARAKAVFENSRINFLAGIRSEMIKRHHQ